MTRDEIMKMARQAGAERSCINDEVWMLAMTETSFEKFAALVAAAEREECAELAEKTICDTHIPTGVNIYGTRAAKAIRARANT